MSYWYEVFDNEQIQLLTRKQAAKLSFAVVFSITLTVAFLALTRTGFLSPTILAYLLITTWSGTAWLLAHRLHRLRRMVWCIKLSDRHIIGYDYTRAKIALDWLHIHRIELSSHNLMVVGPGAFSFEIPHLFTDFATISHRIFRYAETYNIPVYVDGRPWQELNVYELYPFLEESPSTNTSNLY